MNALQRLQRRIREQEYRLTTHANEEMADDALAAADIEEIILSGTVVQRYTHDPRGTRYEVEGETSDGRTARVICRFLTSGVLLIVTAYVPDEG